MSRYIDAELLKQILKPSEWGTPDERWVPEHEIGAMLDYFPAADVQEVVKEWCDKRNCIIVAREDFPRLLEVRHGRWEYTKELYRDPNGNHLFYGKICSECNSVSPYDSPYCMNCGANMQQGVTLVGAKMDEVEE